MRRIQLDEGLNKIQCAKFSKYLKNLFLLNKDQRHNGFVIVNKMDGCFGTIMLLTWYLKDRGYSLK